MPQKISAGLLMYRKVGDSFEVLLAHYGGPLWARKDLGSWTVVKGETRQTQSQNLNEVTSVAGRSPALKAEGAELGNQQEVGKLSSAGGELEQTEDLLQTAKREFTEETGIDVTEVVEFIPLGDIKQRGGKIVHAWAFEDKANKDISINLPKDISTFEMEWPPHSGQIQKFPEIDRAEFFAFDLAREKLNPAQVPFLERLFQHVQKVQS